MAFGLERSLLGLGGRRGRSKDGGIPERSTVCFECLYYTNTMCYLKFSIFHLYSIYLHFIYISSVFRL